MAISTVVILFDMVWFRLHIHSVCRAYEYLGGGNGYSETPIGPKRRPETGPETETARNGARNGTSITRTRPKRDRNGTSITRIKIPKRDTH